jgi:glutamate synthase domain-containing protein 3
MTGGTVVILGSTGWNFGAGMSGGEAFIHDPDGTALMRINGDSVASGVVTGEAAARLRALIARHAAETRSPLALRLTEGWPIAVGQFRHLLPRTEGQASVGVQRA